MGTTFASLINAGYPVFGIDDLAADALKKLLERGLSSAPVVEDGRYVTMAMLPALVAGKKGKVSLGAMHLDSVPAFGQDEQLIEKLQLLDVVDGSVLPVVDEDGRYAGVVLKRDVLKVISDLYHSGEGSSSIEIEVPPPGAKLSEVIATIEKNDASIVSLGSRPAVGASGEGQMLYFRVVTHDFYRLVRNLENYGYIIRYHSPFPNGGYDELREKALEFIRYMDM